MSLPRMRRTANGYTVTQDPPRWSEVYPTMAMRGALKRLVTTARGQIDDMVDVTERLAQLEADQRKAERRLRASAMSIATAAMTGSLGHPPVGIGHCARIHTGGFSAEAIARICARMCKSRGFLAGLGACIGHCRNLSPLAGIRSQPAGAPDDRRSPPGAFVKGLAPDTTAHQGP